MFSWLKYRSSFISRNVRRQNMEWSKGVIFLIATFWPEGLWSAELLSISTSYPIALLSYSGLPHNAVGTLSNHILNIILVGDIEGDLSRPAWWRWLLT